MEEVSERYFIFCFGYNHPEQVAKLVDAPLEEILANSVPCILRGYQRAFAGDSVEGTSVATILKQPETEISSYAVALTKEQIKSLDEFEKYPKWYDRIGVECERPDGTKFDAEVYVQNDHSKFNYPLEEYLFNLAKTDSTFYYLQGNKFDYSNIKIPIIQASNAELTKTHSISLQLEDFAAQIQALITPK
ncbi:unnamed protein product [Moneuplotes crassus]|uniref:Gamma-glutamylcyclotransferase AIG2-like domain-containing protein n=1 Tax=Euplotes crassus TaxID=5936 RepID=A0AAD2D6J7_EUPCR|nr:unnamed protein product [Moneuplotes crassus]